MDILPLTAGADPELFFVNNQGKGVSAHNIIPGTKVEPVPYNNTLLQADGTACEFNINPASTAEEFAEYIMNSLADIDEIAKGFGIEISHDCVSNYDPDYMASLPDYALELGCSPDYNAWTGDVNPKPQVKAPFRTAAGHVHLGFTNSGSNSPVSDHFNLCCKIVKQLDVYLGIPSIIFDSNVKRRELYGKAGAFRPKMYGLEYRVLSNRWIFDSNLTKWVFSQAKNAFDKFFSGEIMEERIPGELITHVINTSDVNGAKKIVKDFGLVTP